MKLLPAAALTITITLTLMGSFLSNVAATSETDVMGVVKERINDGSRQVFVLTWYELDVSNDKKKVQIALSCKNLSASPKVCVQASALEVTDTEGNEYPLASESYFPALRIPSQDVMTLYPRFELPIDSEVSSLHIGGADHKVIVALNDEKSPSDSIPTGDWQTGLMRGSPRDPEKTMKVLDFVFAGNVLLVEIEVSNAGFLQTKFNSGFMYLKDSINIVYKRTSVPTSTQYTPPLNEITLQQGQTVQGWVAFLVGEGATDEGKFMMVYDEPDGSFLNTGTFTDKTPPYLVLPSSVNVMAAPSRFGTLVTYNATASDDHSNPTSLVCNPESGALYSPGPTTVTCRATDSVGNRASGTFVVNVSETLEPVQNVLSLDGRDYVIGSVASYAKIKGFSVNAEDKFIQIEMEPQQEEEITMIFPKQAINGINLIMINGEETPFDIVEENASSTSIKFSVPDSVQFVEVYGAQVVPEFGGVGAAVVFAFTLGTVFLIAKPLVRFGRFGQSGIS